GQDFDALSTDEEIVSFLKELGHNGEINSLNDVVVDHMHQPWRNFAALINKSLSRKTTGLDKLRLSRAQILKDKDDEEEVKDEFVKTPSNDSDDRAKGDEDKEMDYTTSQLYDDVDIRLSKPVNTDKGFVQEEGTDASMTNVQQGNENSKILQVIEEAHVTRSTILQKTKVLVTSPSHSSDLGANVTPRQGENTRRNIIDIITTQWCQQ
nr:hypothetical protein [Tanacetum cinerariifolium]